MNFANRGSSFVRLAILNQSVMKFLCKISFLWGRGGSGSPGLVVMGDDSCSRGHGFKSQHCILDGHDIFHIGKNCIVCLKRPKINN